MTNEYSFWLGDNSGVEKRTWIVDPTTGEAKPLDSQVGGSHYKKYKVQPVEYAMANDLNYCQANAIKYVTRYRDKGGKEDLLKAIHNIQILIELEYGANDSRDEVLRR